ncbi:MAG TPA: ABC transporter permease [Phototrophicaceae bacterium]|jgi:ABC-type dipeptide/oligopeptide/nickel transport system permease subunit|nr:ABC transporter permease [Phototrophicaceae bacterium]
MSAQSTSSVVSLNQPEQQETYRSESLYSKALRRLRRDYITLTAMGVVLIMTILCFSAPIINQALNIDPNATSRNAFLPMFSPGHILGTDDAGRDQLARLLVAGQVSLTIGFVGAFIALTIGLIFGMISGYFGGIVDDIMSWVITTVDSIPSLYLLILIAAIFKPDATSLIFAIALISWTGVTRIIRGQTFGIRDLDYILSARALGASPWRIMFVHIVPNLISITVIVLVRAVGGLMLTEASLSFLGLGVLPPQATWGNMLTKAQSFFNLGIHLVIAPGLAISITVLCLYVIGDGVRDAFDPTSNK